MTPGILRTGGRGLAFWMLLVLAFAAAPLLADDRIVSPRQAYEAAVRGELVLVDVRTPREWQQTGVPDAAVPISMQASDFLRRLDAAVDGDRTRPVALICAGGGRSARLQQQLLMAGYSRVGNVAEGMLGGGAGPGWLKAGLPVKPYAP